MRLGDSGIYFIVTGRQNGKLLHSCFDSLLAQSSSHWHCIYVDDASTDESLEVASRHASRWPDFFTVLTNQVRKYKAVNFIRACQLIPPWGIVAELDADDRLVGQKVVDDLTVLHTFFDIVWTQHSTVNESGLSWDTWQSTPLPHDWSRENASGTAVWTKEFFPGHLRSFKRFLFDYINHAIFFYQQKPLKVAFDMVYYTSLLELVPGDLACFYNQICYEYHILAHNDEFTEKALIASGQYQKMAEFCQTAVDYWFKQQPRLRKLFYEKRVANFSSRGGLETAFVGDIIAPAIRDYRWKLSPLALKRLKHMLPKCSMASQRYWWGKI